MGKAGVPLHATVIRLFSSSLLAGDLRVLFKWTYLFYIKKAQGR